MTHIINNTDSTLKVKKEHSPVEIIRYENLEELHRLLDSL